MLSGVRSIYQASGSVVEPDGSELKVNLKVNQLKDGNFQGNLVVISGGGNVLHAIIDCFEMSTEGEVKYAIVSGKTTKLFDFPSVLAAVKVDADGTALFGYHGYETTDANCEEVELGSFHWLTSLPSQKGKQFMVN